MIMMNNNKQTAMAAKQLKQNMDKKMEMETYVKKVAQENQVLLQENQQLNAELDEMDRVVKSLQDYTQTLQATITRLNQPVTDVYVEDLPEEFGENLETRLGTFIKYLREGRVKVMSRSQSMNPGFDNALAQMIYGAQMQQHAAMYDDAHFQSGMTMANEALGEDTSPDYEELGTTMDTETEPTPENTTTSRSSRKKRSTAK